MSKNIIDQILSARGIEKSAYDDFLNPDYSKKHDPFLLPDMKKAVDRIEQALKGQQKITIYGDYDIDGISATALMLESLEKFGFSKNQLDYYLPDRFTEGYGMNNHAIDKIAKNGTNLIITVDCGSLNHTEVDHAKKLGVDVIVTDHHNISNTKPNAVAVINPKYQLAESPEAYENFKLKKGQEGQREQAELYPFMDLCGVGVAFKLVQALQTRLEGMPEGQEKWLLDLVALGTVCDIVSLTDENRANVYWGLKVMSKLHRPGIKALLAVSGTNPYSINSRSLGFSLGPRLNAAGRLKTASEALELVRATDTKEAIRQADYLDRLNTKRRLEQDDIYKQAKNQAENYHKDPVLVLSHEGWNQGVVGIVASKIMEEFKKPTFIISKNEEQAVGSARSFGDFSVADAIHHAHDHILKGGGHKVAAGVSMDLNKVDDFRRAVNQYYHSLELINQEDHLFPNEDLKVSLGDLSIELVKELSRLEPFGAGNDEPIFFSEAVFVESTRSMGKEQQHVKLEVSQNDKIIELIAFNAPANFFVEANSIVDVWYRLDVNEWNGQKSLVGKIVNLKNA